MQNTTYREMFRGRGGKARIRPIMLKRDEDEDKIETIYLIRDAHDIYNYEAIGGITDALEFHVIYDKGTRRSSGTLYYDVYNMNYTRQTSAKVQWPYYGENYIQAYEGYKCTGLDRYKVQFFPPEINSINALDKYIENRLSIDLEGLRLISTIEIEGLKQTLREKFKLDQNKKILIDINSTLKSNFFDQYSNNEYFFGAAIFNNRCILFRESLDKKLQLLECKLARKIRTRKDFVLFCCDCLSEALHYCYDVFAEGSNLYKNVAKFINNNPRFFIREKEKPIIELDMHYKDTLVESNREPADPVINNLICKALETVALQGYKHFTGKDIGFRYNCVDGLKIRHNIQDKQRIDLTTAKRLQFFKEQQLNHIQNAGNEMFANERLHD